MKVYRSTARTPVEQFARRWLKLLGILFVGVPIILFIFAVAYEIAILVSLVLFGSSGG